MKEGQNTFNKSLKMDQKNKTAKKYQKITRRSVAQIPKVRSKSISLHKFDYHKEYSLPLKDENDLQFWGCVKPPRKIKVKNPFLNIQTCPQRNIVGQSKQILRSYLNRKQKYKSKVAFVDSTFHDKQEDKFEHFLSSETKMQKNDKDCDFKTLDTKNGQKSEPKGQYSSIIISDYEETRRQPYCIDFPQIKQNPFVQRLHQLNHKIMLRNSILSKLNKDMATIRYKKMGFVN